jgi:hypothetical protein
VDAGSHGALSAAPVVSVDGREGTLPAWPLPATPAVGVSVRGWEVVALAASACVPILPVTRVVGGCMQGRQGGGPACSGTLPAAHRKIPFLGLWDPLTLRSCTCAPDPVPLTLRP